MSVIVITRFPVAAAIGEELANGKHRDTLLRVAEDGKAHRAIHHAFAEDTEGNLLAIDEWESEEEFHAFFDSQQDIQRVMADAGVSGPPVTTSYRVLSTPDRF